MKVNRVRLTFRQPTVANWVFYPFFEVSIPLNVRFMLPTAALQQLPDQLAHAAPLHISRWTFKGGRATPNRGMPPLFSPAAGFARRTGIPPRLEIGPMVSSPAGAVKPAGPEQKSSRRALLCGCLIWFYRPRHSSGRRRLRSCSAASMVRSMASLSRFSVPFSTR